MAHLNDGTLRRMLDDADAVTAPERDHFAACADCKSRQVALAGDADSAARLLTVPSASFDASAAYQRITARPASPRFGFRLPVIRAASRPVLAAAALVLVLAVSVTAAVNVTDIFKPQTVQPVSISVVDLQSLPDLGTYGDFKWSQQPSPQVGITKAQAETTAGFSAPSAKTLPPGVTSSTDITYAAMNRVTATFTFSAAKAQAAAAAKGETLPAMPAGMDGSTLTFTAGPAILELYGDLNTKQTSDVSQAQLPALVIASSKAPVVTSSGVSTKELEDYLLKQPGITPGLAADIKAIGNPSTTLIIPVPIQYATSTQVKVHGVQGVALGDNTGIGAAVIWIKDGNVYFVGGSLKQSDALAVANSLS